MVITPVTTAFKARKSLLVDKTYQKNNSIQQVSQGRKMWWLRVCVSI